VIRFLLRDAKETSKLAILDDSILQQIVLNSNAIHHGLQCKVLHLNKNLKKKQNSF
jgi:hypothetical protein